MKRLLPALAIALIILISGCVEAPDIEKPDDVQGTEYVSEELGGRYQGQLITREGTFTQDGVTQPFEMYDISYTKNARTMRGYFIPELRPALEWIRDSTPEEAVFFGWWDYGHMIQGFTGRDAVIFSPSLDMLWSLSSGSWDEEASGPMSSNDAIKDVAFGLLNSDPEILASEMEKYNSQYAFITQLDSAIVTYWLEYFHQDKYLEDGEVKGTAAELLVFRMLAGEPVEGFEPAYSGKWVKIYQKT